MSGFSNPVTNASGDLIRERMKSPNYTPGTTGWQVESSGSAEFNDVILRGTLTVSDVDGSEIRIFAQSAGSGVLIELLPATIPGHVRTAGYILAEGDPVLGPPYVLMRSPQLDASDYSWIVMQSGDASAVPSGSTIQLRATESLRLEALKVLSAGPIHGKTPGSTFAAPVTETWHGLTYANAWANDGPGFVTGQYRLVASPPNTLQIVGTMTPGVKADGTVIAVLPAGYRPLNTVTFPVSVLPLPAGTMTPLFQLEPSGNLKCYGLTAGSNVVYVNAQVPLDA